VILTQARTWSGGGEVGARLKGWDTAQQTILRCLELNPRTRLTTFSVENRHVFPKELAHLHYQGPSDPQLALLYSQAGLYLLTSQHEGFGLTAAEAMACGCPVVATLAQGNEEFCIDGVTALTAPAGDVEQLARKCVQLQSDPQLARQLGENGRSYILRYTWGRVIDRLEREFLERGGPEIIMERPAHAISSDQAGAERVEIDDEEFRSEFHEKNTLRRSDEYPDLHLDEEPAADCTVVIPTIGDIELVSECISSCRRFVPEKSAVQFIVVDDGTRDRTAVRELRRAAVELDFLLLSNHQNLGFSASVNYGLRQARGRYVVLCNSDIVFFQPWLEALEQAFTADPNLGVLGCRLLYPDGTIQHAGVDKVPGQLRFHHTHAKQPGNLPSANQSRYVWCVTGALFAIRRQTLQKLGGLSTAYATAFEDLDYCLHAWMHGERVGYCAEVTANHLEGATRGATEAAKSTNLLWAERERAGGEYFEKKWKFLRHVENFQSLLSFGDRQPRKLSRQPVVSK
jgi:GT2 family glycosyltransferase